MGNTLETYSHWEPKDPNSTEDDTTQVQVTREISPQIFQVPEVPRVASPPPRVTDTNQEIEKIKIDETIHAPQTKTPIVVTSTTPKTTPNMKWTRVITKVQAVNKFASPSAPVILPTPVINPEPKFVQIDIEMPVETDPIVDSDDYPFDLNTSLVPATQTEQKIETPVDPAQSQITDYFVSLSQLIDQDLPMESDDEDKTFDTPATHTESSSSSQSHVSSSTSSTEDFSSHDSPVKLEKPETDNNIHPITIDLNQAGFEDESEVFSPRRSGKSKTKGLEIFDKPVEILDKTDYSSLPRDRFVEAPRRSSRTAKRNRSDSSDTSPKQPKPKRKKTSPSSATPPKTSPTKADTTVIRNTASKKNYGATPARPSPSTKNKVKVAKMLNYEDADS